MTDTSITKEGVEDQELAEYYERRKLLIQAMTDESEDPDAVLNWYDKEADIYEAQFDKAGFEYPSAFVETTLALVENKLAKILDVAAGSGKVGMKLRKRGYTNIDGLDASATMLALAKEKAIYNNYICCTVGPEKLQDIPDASYDFVFCAAGIGRGHLPLETIPTMLRAVKPTSYDFVFCAAGIGRGHLPLETIPTMLRAVKPNGYLHFNHSLWSAQFPEYSFDKLDRIIEVLKENGMCSSSQRKEGYLRPGEPTSLYILRRGGDFGGAKPISA